MTKEKITCLDNIDAKMLEALKEYELDKITDLSRYAVLYISLDIYSTAYLLQDLKT